MLPVKPLSIALAVLCASGAAFGPDLLMDYLPGTTPPMSFSRPERNWIVTQVLRECTAAKCSEWKHAEWRHVQAGLARNVSDQMLFRDRKNLALKIKPEHRRPYVAYSLHGLFAGDVARCLGPLEASAITVKALNLNSDEVFGETIIEFEKRETNCAVLTDSIRALPLIDPDTIPTYTVALRRFTEVISYAPDSERNTAIDKLTWISKYNGTLSGREAVEAQSEMELVISALPFQPKWNETIAMTMHADERDAQKRNYKFGAYGLSAAIFIFFVPWVSNKKTQGKPPEAESLFLKLMHYFGLL